MSDENGEGVDAARYTAFGELVEGASHRYGYAGAYGYQTDTDGTGGPGAFPFLHVGARYYDPATGRFLQRDPIGILGGLNVYEYARGLPTLRVDPNGLFWGAVIKVVVRCASWVAKKVIKPRKVKPPKKKPPKKPKKDPEPYPVTPEEPADPDLPPPFYPGEDDHVVPSKPPNLPSTPPEYDPNEPWPLG